MLLILQEKYTQLTCGRKTKGKSTCHIINHGLGCSDILLVLLFSWQPLSLNQSILHILFLFVIVTHGQIPFALDNERESDSGAEKDTKKKTENKTALCSLTT